METRKVSDDSVQEELIGHIKAILTLIGEDPEREGLKETPKRVAKMYKEIYRGYDDSQLPRLAIFDNGKDGITYDEMVVDTGYYFSQCFTGDTQISTPKGIFRIKDLVGKDEKVYCYSEKDKRFTISNASNIKEYGKKSEVWKLTTDYNTIYATPDHKFLTYNRGWVMLKDLQPKDSLVALNTRLFDDYLYLQVDESKDGWVKEHQFIYKEISGEDIKSNEVIHHIDHNKNNNDFSNLKKMTNKEHSSLHSKEFQESLTEEEKSLRGKIANRGFVNLKNSNPEKFKEVRNKATQSLKNMYNSEKGIELRKKKSEQTKKQWADRKMKNHKVVKVEYYGHEAVYCMDVEKYHNFVANGLVVHNCEHHTVPFFGDYYFAYIPGDKILGLSKVARIVDHFSAKLQIQERLVKEILDYLEKELQPKGIALVMKGRHLCKEMRGVKKVNGYMITSDLRGAFKTNPTVRAEFLSLIK